MNCKKCDEEMETGKADCRDMADDDEENFNPDELDCHICKKCNYVFVEL